MKAPKEVIDELDRWAADEHNEFCINGLLDGISVAYYAEDSSFSTLTAQWVYKNHRTPSEDLPYEYAVIDHVFGDERLQPEREPKYYVSSEDNDDETVVYFMTDLGIIDCALFDIVLTYENGLSKQLAEAIVAEVGGEIREIK